MESATLVCPSVSPNPLLVCDTYNDNGSTRLLLMPCQSGRANLDSDVMDVIKEFMDVIIEIMDVIIKIMNVIIWIMNVVIEVMYVIIEILDSLVGSYSQTLGCVPGAHVPSSK